MIFQNPLGALDPRMTAGETVAEALTTHERGLPRHEVRSRAAAMLERVGLLPEHMNRYPHEFSGGQCQRIGIARALIVGPRLVICDEPVSALDVSVQAQIVNLLQDLQRDLGLSLIFISHDLGVVKHIADRIMVFYLGRVLEHAAAGELVRAPVPDPAVERGRQATGLGGELPSPLAPPSGCVFHTRCPIVRDACADEVPAMREVGEDHVAACPYDAG